jgi:single-strand DNA-binding protein
MATLFGLARIGRDAELRHGSNGDAVMNLSLAFNYRSKGEKLTQWVDASMWGKLAESLAPYIKKGGLVSISISDVHMETFKGKNGESQKLVGRVSDIELAGSKDISETIPARKPKEKIIIDESDLPF